MTDVFAFDWTAKLLQRILGEPAEAFEPMLATLHVGDQLAAIDLMLRSRGVIHCWFAPIIGPWPGTLPARSS